MTTIYDDLVFSNIKNDFEIGENSQYYHFLTAVSLIMDIGSGQDPKHVNAFNLICIMFFVQRFTDINIP